MAPYFSSVKKGSAWGGELYLKRGFNLRDLWFKIQYYSVRLFIALMLCLPFSFLFKISRPVGIFLYHLLDKKREMALENLKEAYGDEKTEEEIIQIAKESFIHLGEFASEYLWMFKASKEPSKYFEIEGERAVKEALQKEKGILFLVSHNPPAYN